MNDEGRLHSAPATSYQQPSQRYRRTRSTVERLRSAIAAALEAIEVGDLAYACDLLLDALEDGEAKGAMARCRFCSLTGWPGLVEAHELRSHPRQLVEAEEAERAA